MNKMLVFLTVLIFSSQSFAYQCNERNWDFTNNAENENISKAIDRAGQMQSDLDEYNSKKVFISSIEKYNHISSFFEKMVTHGNSFRIYQVENMSAYDRWKSLYLNCDGENSDVAENRMKRVLESDKFSFTPYVESAERIMADLEKAIMTNSN